MMMGCVLGTMKMNGMPDTCWASDKIANINDALMILIGTATDKITDFPVDVGMFKDCPGKVTAFFSLVRARDSDLSSL